MVESVQLQYSRKSTRDGLQNDFAASISYSQLSEKMQLCKQQPSVCLGAGELQQVSVSSVGDRCSKQRGTTAVPNHCPGTAAPGTKQRHAREHPPVLSCSQLLLLPQGSHCNTAAIEAAVTAPLFSLANKQ